MQPELPRYQVALRYTALGSALRNDMQILMISYATGRVDRGGDGRTPLGIAIQPVLNLAVGRGEIRLRSADPAVQPSVDFNMLAEPEDRRRLGDGVRLAIDLAAHRAFAGLLGPRIAPGDEPMEDYLLREVTHTNHLSGTCAIGDVVDRRGRVVGFDGLRVADCSIMPDCVRANTNATAMMVGERMAALMVG